MAENKELNEKELGEVNGGIDLVSIDGAMKKAATVTLDIQDAKSKKKGVFAKFMLMFKKGKTKKAAVGKTTMIASDDLNKFA